MVMDPAYRWVIRPPIIHTLTSATALIITDLMDITVGEDIAGGAAVMVGACITVGAAVTSIARVEITYSEPTLSQRISKIEINRPHARSVIRSWELP